MKRVREGSSLKFPSKSQARIATKSVNSSQIFENRRRRGINTIFCLSFFEEFQKSADKVGVCKSGFTVPASSFKVGKIENKLLVGEKICRRKLLSSRPKFRYFPWRDMVGEKSNGFDKNLFRLKCNHRNCIRKVKPKVIIRNSKIDKENLKLQRK